MEFLRIPSVVFLTYLSLNYVAVCSGSAGHEMDPFHELTGSIFGIESSVLNSSQSEIFLSKLIEVGFMKLNCSDGTLVSSSTNCSTCLTAANVKSIIGYNDTGNFTEEHFEKSAAVLVYFLTNVNSICANIGDPSTRNMSYYDSGLMHIGLGSSLVEPTVKKIIEKIVDGGYNREAGESQGFSHVEASKCADVEKVAEVAKISESTVMSSGSDLHTSVAALLYYIYKGYLIKEGECPVYPEKTAFLEDLHTRFGFNESQPLSEEGFEKLLKELDIGNSRNSQSHDSHGHAEHGDTHKRRKRSADSHGSHGDEGTVNKCYSGDDLFTIFNIDHEVGLNSSDFGTICPALIQQKLSKSCEQTTTKTNVPASQAEIYGYGTLAIAVISLTALFGAAVIPCMGGAVYKCCMVMFIGLAVGTMSGDALLHLIPLAVGLHAHASDPNLSIGETIGDHVWKLVVMIAALYVFFIFEMAMKFFGPQKVAPSSGDGEGHGHSHGNPDEEVLKTYKRKMSVTRKSLSGSKVELTGQSTEQNGIDNMAYNASLSDLNDMSNKKNKKHDNGKSTDAETGSAEMAGLFKGVSSMVIMIVVGDTIHNFADGMAVGAAFAQDIPSGIATSIAVLCHELPHELGDFAVLIASGMSLKKALLLNLVSACIAFIGLYIGIAVAIDESVRSYIFAVTAGMFIYVSLVDMLPTLMASDAGSRCKTFIFQNIGLLFGYFAMFLLAIFEQHIKF